jgi:DNA-binding beta-propeller fold protein YncE
MFSRTLRRCAVFALLGSLLGSPIANADTVANSTVRLAKIAVPGKALRSFDIGWGDPAGARYYLADRSNAAVDVIDTTENAVVGQIKGFKGFTGDNDTSGPNGIVVTVSKRELWGGDGDSTVKVVDLGSGSITDTISTGGKNRADELAFDFQHGVIVIANDADDPPFLSFINSGSHSVMKKLEFPDATDGLEQPVFDSTTGLMYQAIPATKDHPGGEIAVLDDTQMAVTTSYPLTDCEPHGLAVGPNHQLLVGCSVEKHTMVLNDTNGRVLADLNQTGGSDEVWFNPGENRYYTAGRSAQTLGIVDANTNAFVENVESGVGAHSVAADAGNNHIFVPIAGPDPACPNGCIAVFASVKGDRAGMPRNQ